MGYYKEMEREATLLVRYLLDYVFRMAFQIFPVVVA
jgi:hypothetical protein